MLESKPMTEVLRSTQIEAVRERAKGALEEWLTKVTSEPEKPELYDSVERAWVNIEFINQLAAEETVAKYFRRRNRWVHFTPKWGMGRRLLGLMYGDDKYIIPYDREAWPSRLATTTQSPNYCILKEVDKTLMARLWDDNGDRDVVRRFAGMSKTEIISTFINSL